MTRQAQQGEIVVGDRRDAPRGKVASPADEAGARTVLEAPIPFSDRRDLEQVAIERRTRADAVEQLDLPVADACEVARKARQVSLLTARDDDIVRRAARLERRQREMAHFDRMVDQCVIAVGAIAAEAVRRRAVGRQRRGNAPLGKLRSLRCRDDQLARGVSAAFWTKKDGSTVEVGALRIQVRRSHRKVVGIDVRNQAQRSRASGRAPGILGFLDELHRAGRRLGPYTHEMSRELADQVAARNPGGQAETLPLGIRIIDRARDLEQVRMRSDGLNAVPGGRANAGQGVGDLNRLDCARSPGTQRRVATIAKAPRRRIERPTCPLGGGCSIH